MFPRYRRLCLTMTRAARHCSMVWLMGWMALRAISFLSSRSQAVCWKALVVSKWPPPEISRFMMSGWPLDAATCRGLRRERPRQQQQQHGLDEGVGDINEAYFCIYLDVRDGGDGERGELADGVAAHAGGVAVHRQVQRAVAILAARPQLQEPGGEEPRTDEQAIRT
ncbi:hypothetical protein CRUP_001705, partial [Coryphaenoides rupestris]